MKAIHTVPGLRVDPGSDRALATLVPTVLIGALPPPASGMSLSFEMLCHAFRESRIPHRVISISNPRADARVDGRFGLRRVGSFARPVLSAARQLLLRRRGNVYLLIAQSWSGFLRDVVFIALAKLGGHRVVVHLKGGNYDGFYRSQPRWRRWLIRRTLGRVDRILVLADCFVDHFGFVPRHRNRVRVVLNGLPVSPETLGEEPKHLPGESGGPIRLLFLSNLVETKGYLELLDAVRVLVKERGWNIQCRFCGAFVIGLDSTRYATPEEAETDFRRRVSEFGLADHVTWTGPVSGEQKARELREAHFFVLPTSFGNEGQPVSIIEALAASCVVVSTRFRSIPTLLDGGRCGVLIGAHGVGSPETSRETAAAIEELLRDPAAYTRLSQAARLQYLQRFTREAHLRAIIPEIVGPPQQWLARRLWRTVPHHGPVVGT